MTDKQVFNEIKRVLNKMEHLSAVPMEAVICRKLPIDQRF